jgi:phage antirepressor YoqD-like protein
MRNIVFKQYNRIDIPFGIGKNVWLNATKAAKVFGKRPANFFQTESTLEHLNALAEAHGYAVTEKSVTKNVGKFSTKKLAKMFPQFIHVRHGNGNAQEQGTWISKELVINYSRWLDAKFAVWCDVQIQELYAAALRELADTVEKKMRLEMENAEIAPKAAFFDAVTQSDDEFDMHEVAKILNLGFGRNTLLKKLRDDGILMDDNAPYQKYVDAHYFRLVESTYVNSDGKRHVSTKPVCTQKGIDFILRRYSSKISS